jgi:hypothetical protein
MDDKTRTLAEALSALDDLDRVALLVAREQIIREGVAETGEAREHVADLFDAMVSMDQEAVLDLTEGEPTTLRDGLRRYVDDLQGAQDTITVETVVSDLNTLLTYPWPGSE